MLYCVECGCCSGELGKDWVAFRCDDPEHDEDPRSLSGARSARPRSSATGPTSQRPTSAPGNHSRARRSKSLSGRRAQQSTRAAGSNSRSPHGGDAARNDASSLFSGRSATESLAASRRVVASIEPPLWWVATRTTICLDAGGGDGKHHNRCRSRPSTSQSSFARALSPKRSRGSSSRRGRGPSPVPRRSSPRSRHSLWTRRRNRLATLGGRGRPTTLHRFSQPESVAALRAFWARSSGEDSVDAMCPPGVSWGGSRRALAFLSSTGQETQSLRAAGGIGWRRVRPGSRTLTTFAATRRRSLSNRDVAG